MQVAYDEVVPLFQSKKARFGLTLLALLVCTLGGWFVYRAMHPSSPLDAPMLKALDQVSKVTAYSQYVETETTFPERSLKISGTYYVDNAAKQYVSHSTTTLFITGNPTGHSFTHDDITIQDNVFFKVLTTDPVLKASIKSNPKWIYYKNGTIPADLADIAIVGPLQDNLSILSNNGAYLTLVKKDELTTWDKGDNEPLLRYTFTLSKEAAKVPDGPLNALVGRLSPHGTVDVWIDPSSFSVRYMLFKNAPYFSTTTITGINTPKAVTPPISIGS